jgi:hypothetical protein
MQIVRKIAATACTVLCWIVLGAATGHAAEGGFSDYFPGAFGSFLVNVAPQPGLMLANQTLIYGANVNRAVLDGRVDTHLNTFAVFDLLSAAYTADVPMLGGRFQLGGFLPVGHVSADFRTGNGSHGLSGGDTNIGDLGLVPASFYWDLGDFHVKAAELIVAPTGHYDVNQKINTGRNYWAFDTQVGLTWFNPRIGTEVSLLPGIMVNTENEATNYRTGTEFHLDFMVNQFLSQSFAIGFQGYYYKQISGDSGSGAVLGSFQGESVGVGPAVLWLPELGHGNLSLIAKWLHDLEATNRLNGDYGQVTAAYRF